MYYNKKPVSGTTVIVVDNNVEKAIRKLKKISAPIIKEYRDKRYFVKKSIRNRLKRKAGKMLARKNAMKLNEF